MSVFENLLSVFNIMQETLESRPARVSGPELLG